MAAVVLYLMFATVRVPLSLLGRDREDRDRRVRWWIRAGLVVCLVGHLAMAGSMLRSQEEISILSPRVTARDYARVLKEVLRPAAAGWGGLAWTLLVLAVCACVDWKRRSTPLLLVGAAFLCAAVLIRVEESMFESVEHGGVRYQGIPGIQGTEAFFPEEALMGGQPDRGFVPGALESSAGALAFVGMALLGVEAVRRVRSPATVSTNGLVVGGLLTLSASVVWLLSRLDAVLFTVVILGPLAPPLSALQRAFLADAWLPWTLAWVGLVACAISTQSRRAPRAGSDATGV
jgi:hypothetical protein